MQQTPEAASAAKPRARTAEPAQPEPAARPTVPPAEAPPSPESIFRRPAPATELARWPATDAPWRRRRRDRAAARFRRCPASPSRRRRPTRGCLATPAGRSDDRFEIGQRRTEIVRPRGIEQDQVELAVDDRADRAAPCATARRCRDAHNRTGSRWCRGTAAAAARWCVKSTAPPRTRNRLSSIAAISGGGHVRPELGHLPVVAACAGGPDALPSFRPVTKLIPSR